MYWRGVTEEPLTLEGVKKVTMESFINIFEVRVLMDVRLILLLLTLLTVTELTSHTRDTSELHVGSKKEGMGWILTPLPLWHAAFLGALQDHAGQWRQRPHHSSRKGTA